MKTFAFYLVMVCMVCFFVAGQAFFRGFHPVLAVVASAAQGKQRTQGQECKDKEPKKAPPPIKPTLEYKVYPFKHFDTLQLMRDVVEAFTEAFPEIRVAPLENNYLLIMGDNRDLQRHYSGVAKTAAELLDKRELKNGYYIGNHIVRLTAGNACAIARRFQDKSEMQIIGLSEKVLLIIPKKFPKSRKSGQPEISIELERRVAGFKSRLVKADSEIARALTKDKEEAKKKSQPEKAKPSVTQAESPGTKPTANQPEKAKKKDSGKQPASEPKSTTTPEDAEKNPAPLDESAKPKQEPPPERAQGALVRLFHLRNPAAVAAAFKRVDDDPVKAVGPELVLIDPKDGKLATIQAIERILAVLDLPRPQIGLQFWSMQVSTEDPTKTDDQLNKFRATVSTFNEELRDSLQRGWQLLMKRLKTSREEPEKEAKDFKSESDFRNYISARDFMNYIEMDFMSCSREDRYCLGYQDAFLASTPSLTRMLLFMAALPEPSREIGDIIQAMEGNHAKKDAKKEDKDVCRRLAEKDETPKPKTCFENFKKELESLFRTKETLSIFRAAILDFLFHYKWAKVYPREFVPYDLKVSAHVLDSMLTPIHDAFARDLGDFVEMLRDSSSHKELTKTADSFRKRIGGIIPNRHSKENFYSNGLSRVTTLSGTQAKSAGTTSNVFDITAPISLNELLKENELIDKGLPGVFQTKESKLAGIAANLLARPKVIAEVGRGMTLTITPIALETAASAELQVDLRSGEAAAPAVASGPTDKKPTIDRVTEHTVTDTVRVESLKLFEISTFGMQLEGRKDYIFPVVGDIWQAVFGGVPILNGLFRVEGGAVETISHRSVAIVSAMVVPTAMDLAYSIRFESDRELLSEGSKRIKSAKDLFADARAYHKLKMRCLRESKEPTCTGTDGGMKLTTSNVIGDEAEIK